MSRVFLPLFSLACLLTPLYAQTDFSNQWLIKDAQQSGDSIVLQDANSASELRLATVDGVLIGEAPAIGDDKASLIFSGSQANGFKSEYSYPPPTSSVRVKLDLKPVGDADTDGCILRNQNYWELRHLVNQGVVAFIIWHGDLNFSQVEIPVDADRWQTIEAKYADGEISVSNGTDTSIKPLSEPIRMPSARHPLMLGKSYPVDTEEWPSLLFEGAVANICIGVE